VHDDHNPRIESAPENTPTARDSPTKECGGGSNDDVPDIDDVPDMDDPVDDEVKLHSLLRIYRAGHYPIPVFPGTIPFPCSVQVACAVVSLQAVAVAGTSEGNAHDGIVRTRTYDLVCLLPQPKLPRSRI